MSVCTLRPRSVSPRSPAAVSNFDEQPMQRERSGWVGDTPVLCYGGPWFKSMPRELRA
jgi:hypothetical protein